MLCTFAVLGASGFVGSRLLEVFHLGELAALRPVVRQYSSLACLARFDLDWRIADACDMDALTAAFSGCDAVINLIAADPAVIVRNATVCYQAAQAAGVKRIVYLSSASVHGQSPAPGTDETSPLHTKHVFAYNNAKVQAEKALIELRRRGSVELVILRPGIVFGPRSRWVSDIANQLLANTAYLINNGEGICNSIYVDNLIHAIRLALTVPAADRNVFLVGDRERVTWLHFYGQIASGLGVDLQCVPRLDAPQFEHGAIEQLERFRSSRSVQALLPMVPSALKSAVKGAISAATAPPQRSPWVLPSTAGPQVTEEFAALHQCSVQLPWSKAASILDYQPPVSFAEGMARSLDWLAFAGYPVRQ
jgi:nucleoside-diphosphate-sugar epimerase